MNPEPPGVGRVGVLGPHLGQLGPNVVHADALCQPGPNRDVELEHAGTTKQPLEILGIVQAGTPVFVGSPGRGDLRQIVREVRELLDDLGHRRLTLRRAIEAFPIPIDHRLAVRVPDQLTTFGEIQHSDHAGPLETQGHDLLVEIFVGDLGISQAPLDRMPRSLVFGYTDRTTRRAGVCDLQLRIQAFDVVISILQFCYLASPLSLVTEPIDGGSRGKGPVQLGGLDLRSLDQPPASSTSNAAASALTSSLGRGITTSMRSVPNGVMAMSSTPWGFTRSFKTSIV